MGMLNICFWVVALFPQIYENYKNKSTDALSISFLVQWFLGDCFNLLGCLWTNQLPMQLWTAVYFCLMDIVMLVQYVYYSFIARTMGEPSKYLLALTVIFLMAGSRSTAEASAQGSQRLLLAEQAPLCNQGAPLSDMQVLFGSVMAWLSGLTYFICRVPQIVKNWQRKSVEGLSLGLFFCSVSANTFYGMGIILRTPQLDAKFYRNVLPYIIGSMGTLVFDITILAQAWLYRGAHAYQPLAEGAGVVGVKVSADGHTEYLYAMDTDQQEREPLESGEEGSDVDVESGDRKSVV